MTKISNQYSLTNILTADLANSRLGINNVSPTVALDVTGAGKFSGILTLGSTISNGTYAYTLPSATGTLALTSALSSYLPLTGGTLTGALGGTTATFSGLITGQNGIYQTNAASLIASNRFDTYNGGTTQMEFNYPASGSVAFINGTERMRITSAGNVGIGTTSPTCRLDVRSTYVSDTTVQQRFGDNTGGFLDFGGNASAGKWINASDGGTSTGTSLIFQTGGTERMRITSDGTLLVGRTTAGLTNTSGTTIYGGAVLVESNGYLFYGNRTTSDGLFMGIRRNNVDVGSITVTTSATAFNTSSDYRLKTDFKDYNGLSLINSIKTYDYAWAIDNTRAYGVKAHELQELLPYMVFGEKDATNEDDSIKPQAVDYSKLVPVLVKAIQELSAENTSLINRIEALENK